MIRQNQFKPLSSARPRFAWLWIGGFLMLCLGACNSSESWHAGTYAAHGSISINGEPPEGLLVILKPVGEPVDSRESTPWGIVDGTGRYDLTTYNMNDGAPQGKYAVTLNWPLEPGSTTDRLGRKYLTPENAPLQVSITQGENEIQPIELTGVRLVSKK